jgi:ArsR family transcriptional regulator
MNSPTQAELNLLHSNVCAALSDPKRILILYALYEQPLNVSTLADFLDFPQPTVSRHLRVLRQRALVLTERDGPSVIYRLADDRIISVLNTMRAILHDSVGRQASAVAHLT